MKKVSEKLLEVLPFYLGCELYGTYNDNSGSKGILTGVTNGGHECEIQFFLEDGINVEEEPTWNDSKELKLILRPLSDIQIEDLKHLGALPHIPLHADDVKYVINRDSWQPRQFHYLLSKGFDLFNLIPEGLAIDRTKII